MDVTNSPVIKVSKLDKVFKHGAEEVHVLRGVDLEVPLGQFLCIIGPSGCGKTTLLRIVAGLEKPTCGTIYLPPEVRGKGKIGMVFQNDNLFPWRTVERNLEFCLEIKGVAKEKRKEITEEWLNVIGLEKFRDYYPKELSGGMRQRVAIARLLVCDPELLLLDEPFGALDAQTRNECQLFLLNLWMLKRKTILFVTHSVDEAVFLAERIVGMGSRPSCVKLDMEVPIPYIRDRTAGEFNEIRRNLLSFLENEKGMACIRN